MPKSTKFYCSDNPAKRSDRKAAAAAFNMTLIWVVHCVAANKPLTIFQSTIKCARHNDLMGSIARCALCLSINKDVV